MLRQHRLDRRRVAANSFSESSEYTAPRLGARKARGPIKIYDGDSDNDGTRLFRARAAYNAHFDLPSGYDPNLDIGSLQCFKLIASFTGTYLSLGKREDNSNTKVWVIEIWGNNGQCRSALIQLGRFVGSGLSQAGCAKQWAKVRSVLSPWGEGAEKRHMILQQRVKLEKYRRDPSEEELANSTFKYAYALPWSEEAGRVEDLLGNQLEALDELRMDGQCHIKFARSTLGANFILLGNRSDTIEKTVKRLQTIPERTFSYTSGPVTLFLLKPLTQNVERRSLTVRQVDYYRPQFHSLLQQALKQETVNSKMVVFERQELKAVQLEEDLALTCINDLAEYDRGAVFVGLKNAERINSQYLHSWVTPVLEQLRFWQGYISMDVQLSVCHFKKYRRSDDVYPIADLEEFIFDTNTGEEDTVVSSAAELGNHHDKDSLLRAFLSASQDFLPYKFYGTNVSLAAKLEDTSPCCRAIFVFGQANEKNLRLEAEYTCNSKMEYSRSTQRWLRNKEATVVKEAPFLAINLLDLEHSHLSHSLRIRRDSLLSAEQEDQLPAAFALFRNRLSLRSHVLRDLEEKLFDYLEDDACKILYHEQTRFWSFAISGTGYVAELSLTQVFEYEPMDDIKQSITRWSREPRWGIRIYHEEWSTILSQNRDIGIGKNPRWIPTEEQFFPSRHMQSSQDLAGQETIPGAGFRKLLRVLKKVDELVKSVGGHDTQFFANSTPVPASTIDATNIVESFQVEESLIEWDQSAPVVPTSTQSHLVRKNSYVDLLADLEDNVNFTTMVPGPLHTSMPGKKKTKARKSLRIRPPSPRKRIAPSSKPMAKDTSRHTRPGNGKQNLFENLEEEEA